MKPLIEVRELSKCFYTKANPDGFWALKDINFTLRQGENLAIIGHNGSGKSTLLKTLSNILLPTSGRVTIRGRVASLLELGTGFHPDLTGRENVYFYGAILGFSRKEIRKEFDAIVDFSGVEAFIDAPIRNYSSGMQMRLAFSVAAFMQSDILLVDEVLAVGDMAFQNKCIKKIQEGRANGRGLIFVAHNLAMTTAMCPMSILLEKGSIKAYDQSKIVADLYSKVDNPGQSEVRFEDENATTVYPISGKVLNQAGEDCQTFDLNEAIRIEMELGILEELPYSYTAGFHIYTMEGVLVFPANYQFSYEDQHSSGKHIIVCEIPPNLLNTGTYYITLACSTWKPEYQLHFKKEDVLRFEITEVISQRQFDYYGEYPGVIRPKVHFNHLAK